MQQKYVIKLLEALDPLENKEFSKFLASPFFVKRKRCHAFYISLSANAKSNMNWTPSQLENIYKKTFPGEKFTSRKLYSLLDQLGGLLKKYFIVQEALGEGVFEEEYNQQSDYLLIQALAKRNAIIPFNREVKMLTNKIMEKPALTPDDYLQLRNINHMRYFHPDTMKADAKEKGIEISSNLLDAYYLLSKLRDNIELINREKVYNVKLKALYLTQEFQAELESTEVAQNPLLDIYKMLAKLFRSAESLNYYKIAIGQYLAIFNILPLRDCRLILHYLINFGIQRFYLKGEKNIEAELLALYHKGLQSGLLFLNNRLTEKTFANIALLMIHLGQFEEIEKFEEKYAIYLNPEKKADVIAWVKANWYFHNSKLENHLDAAELELLKIRAFSSFDFRARSLLLKLYFEIFLLDKKYDFLARKVDGFRKYIKRSKIAEDKKELFNQFQQMISILMKRKKEAHDEKISATVRKEIRKNLTGRPVGSFRTWLNQKIEEI